MWYESVMKTVSTLRDVAQHSGFSLSTVSRALLRDPRIPEATCVLIRQSARALGYQPNPILSALSAHRWTRCKAGSGAVLALLADGELEGQSGMIERAATYGYRTEIFQISDYPSPQRLAEVLFSRGILGLVVGQIYTPGFCAAFEWSRFVAVASSEGCERPPVNLVMPNHFQAIQDGWNHARTLGYRRIGLAMLEYSGALDCRDRHAAFLERQQAVVKADRIPVLEIKTKLPGHVSLQENTDGWLRRYRPEVVLGFNNTFRWAIHDAGWRIPKQVAFISLWMNDSDRETTGLALTTDEVGSRAVDWLDSLLRTGERGIPSHPAIMSVDLRWQAGKTAPGKSG